MSNAGRRRKYDPETMPAKAEEYAKSGYLDKQIAEKFGIRATTFCAWLNKYPELQESLKKGREAANVELKQAMLKTAAGYDVEETETTVILDKDKNPKGYRKTTRKRHIPPSTTMQIFLAKNRMPDEFQDVNRQKVELQGSLKVNTLAELMMQEFSNASEITENPEPSASD